MENFVRIFLLIFQPNVQNTRALNTIQLRNSIAQAVLSFAPFKLQNVLYSSKKHLFQNICTFSNVFYTSIFDRVLLFARQSVEYIDYRTYSHTTPPDWMAFTSEHNIVTNNIREHERAKRVRQRVIWRQLSVSTPTSQSTIKSDICYTEFCMGVDVVHVVLLCKLCLEKKTNTKI